MPEFGPNLTKLGEDHHVLDALVDEIGRLLGNLKSPNDAAGFQAGQKQLYRTVKQLHEHMVQHLTFEEGCFVPAIVNNYSDQEFVVLEKRLQKATPIKHIALLLPWVMSGMDEVEQADTLAHLPGPFRLLYRLSWKKKYVKLTAVFRKAPQAAPELAHR